jgi:MFS family permease
VDAVADTVEDARLGLLVAQPSHAVRGEFVSVSLGPDQDATRHTYIEDGNDRDIRTMIATPGAFCVQEALDYIGFGKYQLYLLGFVGLAWMADAMEMMLLSFIGPAMRCEFGVTADAEGALTSVVFVGMMLGAPGWGILSDMRGRKPALLFSTVTTLVAGIGSALGRSFGAVMFFRFLVGFGIGGVPVAYGIFMEFLPSQNRGVNLTLIELFWTLGSVGEAGLAWVVLPRHSWRVLLLVSTTPLFALLVCIYIAPESALYLVNANRIDEAKETLCRIAVMNGRSLPSGELVHTPPPAFTEMLPSDQTRTRAVKLIPSGVRSLLSNRHRTTSLLLWTIFFGVAFLYYGIVLLTTALNVKDDEDSAGDIVCLAHGAPKLSDTEYADIFISSLAEIPGLIIAMGIVDRIGRRRSMVSTLFVTALFMFPIMFQSIVATFRDILLFCARSSAMSAFTVLYIFAGEVYPTVIRSTGVGVGNGFARIGGIICPFFAVTLIEADQIAICVAFFVGIALVSSLSAFCLSIETAGRKLDADDERGVELTAVPS